MKTVLLKLVSIIVVIGILIGCVPVMAENVTTGNAGSSIVWSFDENSKVLTISGEGAMNNYSGTGGPWSSFSDKIETVIISEGVTSIGNNAFAGCKFVESVNIPGTVTSIGSGVFEGCQNIISVTIPKSVTTINATAFGQTTPKIYCLPGSEAALFASSKGLEISEIKSGDVHTGSCGNTATWSVDEASGVMTISGDGEMNNYPDSASVPWQAYRTMIKVINVDGKITSIGNYVFSNAQNLTTVVLPSTVKSIGNSAFRNCVTLKRISVADDTASIGENAFDNCISLAEFTVSAKNKNFTAENGVLFDKDKTKLIAYPSAGAAEEYTVPDSVKTIGKGAFSYAKNLKKVNLGKGVKTIEQEAFFKAGALTTVTGGENISLLGQEAFRECSSLEKFDVEKVAKIDLNAFSYCSKLKEVKLGAVEEICDRAFYLCSSIEKIDLPATLKVFDGGAFNGCAKLKEVNFDSSSKYFTVDDAIVYNKDKSVLVYAPEGLDKESHNVKEGVKEISRCAFYNTKAAKITLPSSLEIIGDSAFYNSALTSVIVPDKTKEIGEYAFAYGSKIKNLKIGAAVTEIKKAAFSNCSSIDGITIPDGVKIVGDYAFEHCKSAKTLKMSKNITKVGIYAFYKCENITPLKLSSKVDVGVFAFRGCKEITK